MLFSNSGNKIFQKRRKTTALWYGPPVLDHPAVVRQAAGRDQVDLGPQAGGGPDPLGQRGGEAVRLARDLAQQPHLVPAALPADDEAGAAQAPGAAPRGGGPLRAGEQAPPPWRPGGPGPPAPAPHVVGAAPGPPP